MTLDRRAAYVAGGVLAFLLVGRLVFGVNFLAYTVAGAITGLIYGVIALGIVLIYKGSRTLNFAQSFMALFTTFMAWWLTYKAGWFFGLGAASRPRYVIAALLALGLIAFNGLAIERDIMRRLERAPRLVTLVATIAVGLGFLGFTTLLFNRSEKQASELRQLPSLLPEGLGFDIGPLRVTDDYVLALVVVPALTIALAAFFKLTKFGVAIRAAAENRESARLLGISVHKVSSFTWMVGALLAGLAGLLYAPIVGSFDIASLSTGMLVRAFAAALIGGLTSLPGALVGGVIVGVAEFLLKAVNRTPGAPETLLFVMVVAMLIFRPGGLFGQREETEDKVAFIPALRDLPRRIARNPVTRRTRVTAVVVGLMLLAAVSLMTGPSTNGILTNVLIFSTVGVSLTVLIGYAGQVSLGHFGLVGVGAFAAARMYETGPVPFFLMLPIVFAVGMLVSLLIGVPALRIRGPYLAVVTIAFNIAAESFFFRSNLVARGSAGLDMTLPKLGPLDLSSTSNRPFFFFCLATFLLMCWVAYNFKQSRTGRGFFALRENEKAAATMGVELTRYRLLAFALSGGIAAVAGALYGFRLGHIAANSFPTDRSLLLVAMVIIGGLGSLLGSFLGAFLVFGLRDLLTLNGYVVSIGTGILLILSLTRVRGGLAGLVLAARDPVVEGLVRDSPEPPPRAGEPTRPPPGRARPAPRAAAGK